MICPCEHGSAGLAPAAGLSDPDRYNLVSPGLRVTSKRALTTLVGAAAAGAPIWFAPHFDRWATGGYFGAMAVFAAAGLVLGLAQLRGREGNAPVMF
jgi:hypothetical protein